MFKDLPVCTRCCFCLPLRYGLITWGYFRVALSSFFMFVIGGNYIRLLISLKKDDPSRPSLIGYVIMGGLFLLLLLADIILNIVFIVGGHKKNQELLHVYYVYSIFFLVLYSLLCGATTVFSIHMAKLYGWEFFDVVVLLTDTGTILGQLLIQFYVLLLVRSEVIKLSQKCDFRFVNLAAEAECTMKYGEDRTEQTCEKVPIVVR